MLHAGRDDPGFPSKVEAGAHKARRKFCLATPGWGGVLEITPNFVKNVSDKILHRDTEMEGRHGVKAVAQHWRTCIQELKQPDYDSILKMRNETLCLLHPDLWHEGLGRAWSFAAERANMNICNLPSRYPLRHR